jgi:heptosyltransferase II
VRVPYRYGLHEVERNLMLAAVAGWRSEGFRPAIFPDQDDYAVVDRELGEMSDFCVFAPGSVWPTKRWPSEFFVSVGKTFSARGLGVVVSGGTDDREICHAVAENIPGAKDLCGKLTLRQSAELYRRSSFLLTGDTAPQHLAAAVGGRVFSIFGPTIRAFGFWPYDDRARVIEQDNLPCRPCGAHGHMQCHLGHHECMRLISPERVLETIEASIG